MKPRSINDEKDIRLVIFSDAFRHRNGVGAYYTDLEGHLEERLGEAELICPGQTRQGKAQGLSIPLPGDKTQRLCLPGMIKTFRAMRRLKPNIIVLAAPGPYGFLGLALSKLFRVRCIVGYHTQFDKMVRMYWGKFFGGIAGAILRMTDRFFFRLSCLVVANCKEIRLAAEGLGAKDARLVGTPLEPRLLGEPVQRDHQSFGPVLFAGRLAPEKNIEAVLDAARQMPETHFIIAGDGPLRPLVEKAVAALDNIDYRGWLQRPELLRAFDDCEIMVMPSHFETFGTVAMEAMARQRMVMISENCGIREWPELTKGLEMLKADESLSNALKRIAEWTPHDRAQHAATARHCAEDFNRHTVNLWIDLLQEAITKPECRNPGKQA